MASKRKKPVLKSAEYLVGHLVLHRVPDMTKPGRKHVAAWLRKQADAILKEGERYSPLFRAKLFWR